MYFENIRPEDIFRHRMNGRGILIDLRAEEDYMVGHIPGAINIPYAQLQESISKLRKMVYTNFPCIRKMSFGLSQM